MKYFFTPSLFLISAFCFSQKVYSVKYANQADIKVFVVKYENQADLKVYKVKYQNEVGKNDGNWFFVEHQNQADKKIFFVEYFFICLVLMFNKTKQIKKYSLLNMKTKQI